MAQIRIMQMPEFLKLEMMFIGDRHLPRIRSNLDRFLVLPPMEIEVEATGEGEELTPGELLAEEVYDLTNNPGRDDERQERYGNGRSLSSGDVVRTPFGDYLCMSTGWKKL